MGREDDDAAAEDGEEKLSSWLWASAVDGNWYTIFCVCVRQITVTAAAAVLVLMLVLCWDTAAAPFRRDDRHFCCDGRPPACGVTELGLANGHCPRVKGLTANARWNSMERGI
jgi:hypothetical protein